MQKFEQLFSMRLAFWLFVAASCFALLYHTLIIAQVISYANAWGGRLPSLQAMYIFEAISFISQLAFIGFALARYKKSGGKTMQKVLTIIFYLISALLFLNTIGNILSNSTFESLLFTPITLVMAFVALRLAKG